MRRASAAHNPGVSLFPFLAVLICTMGVMMLLLVIINRPGAAAIDDSTRRPAPCSKKVATARPRFCCQRNRPTRIPRRPTTLQADRDMLKCAHFTIGSSRAKPVDDLRDERLRLTTVEDGMRELRDQWEQVVRSRRRYRTSRHGERSRQAVDRDVRRSRSNPI